MGGGDYLSKGGWDVSHSEAYIAFTLRFFCLSTLHTHFHQRGEDDHHLHGTDERTEVISPQSHSRPERDLRFKDRVTGSKSAACFGKSSLR